MKHTLPLLAALAAFSPFTATATVTAASTEDCLADLAAIDATLMRISAGAPDVQNMIPLVDQLPGDKRPVFEDGYCVIHDIRVQQPQSSPITPEYVASALRWQAQWGDDTRPMPPNGLVVELRKAGMSYFGSDQSGDEIALMLDYQSRLVTDLYPNDFRLELAFDPQTDRLEIKQLAGQNGFSNRFTFSAALRGADLDGALNVDWSKVPPVDKLGMIAIERADLSATNQGIFEFMANVWLAPIFPRLGPTPEAAVATAQDVARNQLAQVPDTLVSADSKAALTTMIDAVPHPLGTLNLRLDAPNGIEPSRFVATSMLVQTPSWDSFAGLLNGATLAADWTPAEWPPAPLPPLIAD